MTANGRPVRRVGFGCMRLSTEPGRDDARALATLRAVLDAFAALDPSGTPSSAPTLSLDTAHAYGHDDGDLGHNERLVARALADVPALRPRIEVVTKCGMSRPGGRWEPAGRATDLRASVEGSLVALGVDALDVLLLHAPDPRVPFATSVRALARLHEEGLARRVGLSNVNVTQIREAADHLDVGAVEVALSPHDDAPLRNGVAAWCTEHGVPLFAHSPLGGPKRS
ncbi:MAG: aldo/keto reductase, partial [Deltaproteobacteria bacterium]|nr:aldo/keto reductase [Deltaproteobacteria bacterium]